MKFSESPKKCSSSTNFAVYKRETNDLRIILRNFNTYIHVLIKTHSDEIEVGTRNFEGLVPDSDRVLVLANTSVVGGETMQEGRTHAGMMMLLIVLQPVALV